MLSHKAYTVKTGTTSEYTLLALYLHIPFCQTRCTYCAFNTYTGQSDRISRYMSALAREVQLVAGDMRRAAHTIYFGGGTPSLVPVSELEQVIRVCAEGFELPADVEITLEANPGSVDQAYLNDLRQSGVNRLSVGMQSADEHELRLFARGHSLEDVRQTVSMARKAGFENISLDLIYGVPNQTFNMWRNSLEIALSMNPDHLSLYGLGVEDRTPMQRWLAEGRLPDPDSDLAADMYEWAADQVAEAGYEQYEISNWARPGFACRHNIHYWRNLPYLGFGAGAHGYADNLRYVNVLRPDEYIARIERQINPLTFPLSAAANQSETEHINPQEAMAEMMLMGLRLLQEGISLNGFQARYGHDLWSIYGVELDRLIEHQLVERTPDARVRLTRRGRLLGNVVFSAFV